MVLGTNRRWLDEEIVIVGDVVGVVYECMRIVEGFGK